MSGWLVTASASPPVVTKVFDVSVALERPTHKVSFSWYTWRNNF